MKIARNFVLAAFVFTICLVMWRLPNVKAVAGSCCGQDYSACTASAQSNKTNCQNQCASTYAPGSSQYNSCMQSCANTYTNVDMVSCTNGKTSCESMGRNECYVSCMQHSGGYPVTSYTWKDGCPDMSCTCTLAVNYHPCDPNTKPPWGNPTCDTTTGTWLTNSPILVDWKGEGFHLTSADDGVFFDFPSNGQPIKIAWTDPGYSNAWLVLDRNGNGKIDDAKELFGNLTEQSPSKEPNGYLALAEFDKPENGGNDDGFITSRDSVYSRLRLWVDRNHNGISEPDELHKLSELGIARLDLQYQEKDRTDAYGNAFRYRARVWNTAGERGNRWTWDVYLKQVQ